MYYNFQLDLQSGDRGENLAIDLLSDLGTFTKVSDRFKGIFPGYDLEGPFKVEVKTDIGSQRTGNVAIEYMRKDGTLTGISTTKSDFYMIHCFDSSWQDIIDGEKVYGIWISMLIKPTIIKTIMKNLEACNHLRKCYGGDYKNTIMGLVPITDLRETSEKIYKIPNKAV